MKNWNRQAGWMARSLIGAVLLVYAAMAIGAERISLDSLQTQINNLTSLVSSQQTQISGLQSANSAQAALLQSQAATISALQAALTQEIADRKVYADNVGAATLASAKTYADGKVAPVADKLIHVSRSGNELYISGANLNIRNGKGATYAAGVNGLGNLIIGYNETRSGDSAVNTRTGSHNLIVGLHNNFSSAGAIVAGSDNNSTNYMASVYGGTGNTANGYYSAIVGGYANSATGNWSTILGGQNVTAPNQLDHKP